MRGLRFASFLIVFGLGIGVGMMAFHALSPSTVSPSEAQRRALRLLDSPPMATGIGDNRIVAAAQRIEPAVVNIDTVGRVRASDEEGVPWYVDQEVHGKGSGVILTADGYIVTNNHVIDGANRIRVTLPNGQWYYAHLVGRDPQTDLAMVRVEAHNLPAAELGDSDRLQVGEWSIAVGNPLGLGSSVTVGVVSALNRHNLQIDDTHTLDGVIQTDAAINRGNSGGALANINGQLIGLNTAILSSGPNGGSIGLGFAIPSNTIRRVARDLIATGKTHPNTLRQPWLGIKYGAVPQNIGQAFGLSAYRGVQVVGVLPESPASLAGIEVGDILLSIDGKDIGDVRDVREAVLQRKIGEKATVHLLRPTEHRERDFHVLVQARPEGVGLTP